MSLPIIILALAGLFFGIVLSIGAKVFHVHVDERIKQLEAVLPSANCGACGFAGCAAFADGLVRGTAKANGCLPGGAEVAHKVAQLLGVDADHLEEMVAAVHCKGGDNEATIRAKYDGIHDCHGAVLISNGSKECQYGCLGLSSCVAVCEFDAIHINANGIAEVDPEKCTGCTACVASCPRFLIDMMPKSQKIFLGCNTKDRGAKVKKYCSVGCTGCTLCVKAASHPDSIKMVNNLPVLSFTTGENFLPSAYKCPSDCFVDTVVARPKAHINVKCTGCGDCVPVCPVPNTITGIIGGRHTINKDTCIGCGLCLPVCEPSAIALWGSLGYTDRERRTTGRFEIT